MKIHKEVLPKYSRNLLADIFKNPTFSQFYLAGGTSLALQIGHRESIDLDFFSREEFDTSIMQAFPHPYETVRLNRNSIEIFSMNTKVMFFRFAFPLTQNLITFEQFKFAHPIDIGLMKLLAIQGRTTKKDIIDLYFIDQEIIKLEELLLKFEESYPKESFNSYSSLKNIFDETSIMYEPMPKLLKNADWNVCWETVSTKIIQHIKNMLT